MHNISSAPADIGVDPQTGTDGLTYTAERAGKLCSIGYVVHRGKGERDAVARKRMKNERAAWPACQIALASSPFLSQVINELIFVAFLDFQAR